jgi:hypothetical protein
LTARFEEIFVSLRQFFLPQATQSISKSEDPASSSVLPDLQSGSEEYKHL